MSLLRVFDVLPSPWNARFTYVAMMLTVIGVILIALKSGAPTLWPGAAAIASALLVLVGFRQMKQAATSEIEGPATNQRTNLRFAWFSGGLLVSLAALWLRGDSLPADWLLVAAPFFFSALLCASLLKQPAAALWLFPLVLSSSVLGITALIGTTNAGIFPAIFALLLGIILQALRDLELRIEGGAADDASVRTLTHRRLSWLSVLFFVFGVISLWPWLGKLYGAIYLWILIIGVLFPVMTLWGRLRQPQRDNLMTALVRFNRVLPYASLMLLLAFILG